MMQNVTKLGIRYSYVNSSHKSLLRQFKAWLAREKSPPPTPATLGALLTKIIQNGGQSGWHRVVSVAQKPYLSWIFSRFFYNWRGEYIKGTKEVSLLLFLLWMFRLWEGFYAFQPLPSYVEVKVTAFEERCAMSFLIVGAEM